MREVALALASFSWAMSRFGLEQVAGLAAPPPAADGEAGAAGVTSAGSELLVRAGNLAFELLQLGVDTVYWASGAAWQQQQGLPGWGQVEPPAGDV